MEKIKQWIGSEEGKDVLVVLIVILVGLGSFELGRLSKTNQSSEIKIEYPGGKTVQEANAVSSLDSSQTAGKNSPRTSTSKNSDGKSFFASSRGSKYYSLGCSAGKSIKLENRVYFATSSEAESAGYELSSSCR